MSRLRRLDGYSYIGFAEYFLTICTFDRQPVFVDAGTVDRVLTQFRRAAAQKRFAILAYCLMPDHVHLLVQGLAEDSDLRKFVDSAKQRSGFAHAKATRRRLWQEGYYDRVLRRSEDPKWIARYIVENPVRAKLVESAGEYRFLGSDVWTIDELLESCL